MIEKENKKRWPFLHETENVQMFRNIKIHWILTTKPISNESHLYVKLVFLKNNILATTLSTERRWELKKSIGNINRYKMTNKESWRFTANVVKDISVFLYLPVGESWRPNSCNHAVIPLPRVT